MTRKTFLPFSHLPSAWSLPYLPLATRSRLGKPALSLGAEHVPHFVLDTGGAGATDAKISPEGADFQSPGQRPISANLRASGPPGPPPRDHSLLPWGEGARRRRADEGSFRGTNPSPGPRRLVKAPVAVHPLPSGEG